jgi:hypothetical protein
VTICEPELKATIEHVKQEDEQRAANWAVDLLRSSETGKVSCRQNLILGLSI